MRAIYASDRTRWGGLILSEVGEFKLGNASLKGERSIRFCGDLIRGSAVPEICTSLRSTTNYGKMRFLESA